MIFCFHAERSCWHNIKRKYGKKTPKRNKIVIENTQKNAKIVRIIYMYVNIVNDMPVCSR